jgi:hypothetical protein
LQWLSQLTSCSRQVGLGVATERKDFTIEGGPPVQIATESYTAADGLEQQHSRGQCVCVSYGAKANAGAASQPCNSGHHWGGEGQADADRGIKNACGKMNRPARQAGDVVSISASSLAQACDGAPEAVLLGASVMEVCAVSGNGELLWCWTRKPGEMKMLVPAAKQRWWPMRDPGGGRRGV